MSIKKIRVELSEDVLELIRNLQDKFKNNGQNYNRNQLIEMACKNFAKQFDVDRNLTIK